MYVNHADPTCSCLAALTVFGIFALNKSNQPLLVFSAECYPELS